MRITKQSRAITVDPSKARLILAPSTDEPSSDPTRSNVHEMLFVPVRPAFHRHEKKAG
jgi:hypothetical protein